MGIMSWINAAKYASRLSSAICNFETGKHVEYLISKMEPGAEEIIKEQLIKGFSGNITTHNVFHLGDKYFDFCKKLLPETELNEIRRILDETFVKSYAHKQIDEYNRLSPEGVQHIIDFSKERCSNLYDTYEKVNDDFSTNIKAWDIDNGIFSITTSDFILKPKEECYLRTNGLVLERKQVTSRINYAGPRARIKIAKGLSYNLGSIATSMHKELKDIEFGYGAINITNKNILYRSKIKSLSIPLSSIIDIEFYKDACIIYRSRGNPLIYKLSEQDMFNRHLNVLLSRDI